MTFISQNIKSSSQNIGNSDLTISSPGIRKLIMPGNLSTDGFALRNSADTRDIFVVKGNESIDFASGLYATASLGQNANQAPVLTLKTSGKNTVKLDSEYDAANFYTGSLVLYDYYNNTTTKIKAVKTSYLSHSSSKFVIGRTTTDARFEVVAHGALSTDLAFRVRNSADTGDLFKVQGDGWVEQNMVVSGTGDKDVVKINVPYTSASQGVGLNLVPIGASANTWAYIKVKNTSIFENRDGDSSFFSRIAGTNSGVTYKGHLGAYVGMDYHYASTGGIAPYHNILAASTASRLNNRYWAWGSKLESGVPADANAINASSVTEHMRLHVDGGNLGLGVTTFGTSAEKTFAQGTGVAPTTSPADAFQMYSADIVAGNAAPHFRTEAGDTIKLYKYVAASFGNSINTGDGNTDDVITEIVNALTAHGLISTT